MDLRIGMLQQQLLSKQCAQLQLLHCKPTDQSPPGGMAGDDDDDDDDDDVG